MTTRVPIPKHWHLAASDWGNRKERRKDVADGVVMGVLILNHETGEGEVLLKRSFKASDWLLKADAISDWKGLLEREYAVTLSDKEIASWEDEQ